MTLQTELEMPLWDCFQKRKSPFFVIICQCQGPKNETEHWNTLLEIPVWYPFDVSFVHKVQILKRQCACFDYQDVNTLLSIPHFRIKILSKMILFLLLFKLLVIVQILSFPAQLCLRSKKTIRNQIDFHMRPYMERPRPI